MTLKHFLRKCCYFRILLSRCQHIFKSTKASCCWLSHALLVLFEMKSQLQNQRSNKNLNYYRTACRLRESFNLIPCKYHHNISWVFSLRIRYSLINWPRQMSSSNLVTGKEHAVCTWIWSAWNIWNRKSSENSLGQWSLLFNQVIENLCVVFKFKVIRFLGLK